MPQFLLKSTAFENGGRIPRSFSCDGKDVSPPLHWSGLVIQFWGHGREPLNSPPAPCDRAAQVRPAPARMTGLEHPSRWQRKGRVAQVDPHKT